MKRLLLIFISCSTFAIAGFSQSFVCDVQLPQNDTTICPGQPVQLEAIATPDTINFRYIWSPTTGLSDSTIANPIATPTTTTTYFVTVTTVDSTELVVNGDFEMGDTLFFSEYRDSTSIWNEGTYAITTSPALTHPAFSPCPDHTTGTGNMMNINGTGVPNTVVWRQNVNVTPLTDYEFSAWLMNILPNPPNLPNLRFSINGDIIGPVITATPQDCEWVQFFTTWNSGNSTTATIEITNQSTTSFGNDFTMDDISFRAICKDIEQVTITTIDPLSLDEYGIIPTDTLICDAEPIEVISDYPAARSFTWSTGETTSSITVSTAGTYFVTMLDGCNRTIRDSIVVDADFSPTPNLPSDTTACQDTPITLNAYQPNVDSYQWRGSSVFFQQNDLTDTAFTATFEGVYEVDMTNRCGTITQRVTLTSENCACVPFVPTAFTPNGDGTNDELNVFSECELVEYQFTIYDRWGQLVFVSSDPSEGWNGEIDGEKASPNVYVWRLAYTSPDSRGNLVSNVSFGDVAIVR